MNFDHHKGLRFKEMLPHIAEVLVRHLPGDFQSWEKENSTWDGDRQTVHNSNKDPRTVSCAWAIFSASETPDDFLGFVDRKADEAALDELEKSLDAAANAVDRLSSWTLIRLSKESTERYRQSVGEDSAHMIPPVFNVQLIRQALREGIPAARAFLEEHGGSSRADRRAAAVAGACREVYERRTGQRAPRTALDTPEKKDGMASRPAPFTAFTQEIFELLGIDRRVSSALSRLEAFRS